MTDVDVATARQEKPFDVVVFGATGFTGKRVALYLAKEVKEGVTWAVSGRSEARVEAVVRELEELSGDSGLHETVGVIIANVKDSASLEKMCSQARVVINCVGPYRFYGEPVVAACAKTGTDYVDVTGEPEFIDSMFLKHSREARKNGALIVNACGFDSVPADIGCWYTSTVLNDRGATPSTVESFLTISCSDKGMGGHYATWESAVHGFGSQAELRQIRKRIAEEVPAVIPTVGQKLKVQKKPYFEKRIGRWSILFPGSDSAVVKSSQRHMFNRDSSPPLPPQYCAYYGVSSQLWLLLGGVTASVFAALANYKLGRTLLLKFPRLFSMGLFSHEGPTQEQMDGTSFSMKFFGKGYSSNAKDYTSPPDSKVVTQISGPEPGYIATPIFVVESALAILKSRSRLPNGVMTPAAALRNTDIVDRLRHAGIRFDILEEDVPDAE